MNNSTLTADQRAQAEEFEKVIDDGQLGYIAIGIALMTIQTKQLHDGEFANYVERRFDMKVKQAYRTIRAAKVAQRLQEAELPVPKNEGQAHLLHEMLDDPDDQVEVWQHLLTEKNRPSMGDIKKFVLKWKQEKLKAPDEDAIGEIDLSSSFHAPPVKVPSEVNPLSCLDIAVQQIRTAANALGGNAEDIAALLERINEAELSLSNIKRALSPVKAAA